MRINTISKERSTYFKLLLSLVIVFLISCSEQAEQHDSAAKNPCAANPCAAKNPCAANPCAANPCAAKNPCAANPCAGYPPYHPEYVEETATTEEDSQPGGSQPNKFAEYTVVLGADEHMKIPGLPGELRVWIGSSSFTPSFPTRMTQDETTIPAVGESARVEPFAPAFKIEPTETQCIKIHPSGSEVRFKLIPQKSGTFNVGANVYLFNSLDCTGSPIPKTTASLTVTVEVDPKEISLEKAKELWNIFWEQLLEFWGALVALILALILFKIRSKLKQWFGFDNE